MRLWLVGILMPACLVVGAGGAAAQSLRADDGPAELPPSGYEGRQFVDSEGCVYIRAGVGDTVTWVPRVTRDRKVLCGRTPTFAEAPKAAGKPRPEAAPAAETAKAEPAQVAEARVTTPTERPRTPKAARPRPVEQPAPARVEPAPEKPAPLRVTVAPRPLPEGYEHAWDDGRLNPARGRGTPEGEAQMARIWTNTIPRRLASAAPEARIVWQDETAPARLAAASSRAPAAHVQVGAFARAANAERLGNRLRRRGLPVVIARRGELRVVLAGPFAGGAAAKRALATLRRAGFGDAFIR